ncbi:MAG TPA: FkbM family methyltransferase [Pyrinomonadaceae bacterium]|jgi:FkbM family methyltransferase
MNPAPEQTATQAPELELEELLSENPAEAARRADSRFSLDERDALALYGAGHLGRQVLSRLRSLGLEPLAFADDTPAKQGTRIEGVPVVSPREFSDRFGPQAVFVVTIFNPAASFLRIKRKLQASADARVVSFLELAWKYHETFLPHYQFQLPQEVLENASAIQRAFGLFADEESRRQFVAHLRFRLHLDFAALPASNLGDYFPADVVPELPPDTTFVDCGAFDGDTVRRFIERQRGRFREIYAFEPDAENFRRLAEYAATLAAKAPDRIHLFRAAAGARRARMRFDASAGMASALNDAGVEEVEVLPVQDVVIARGAGALFFKFDVEGAEAAALDGAVDLINSARSIVAVCVYHRPDDLWGLPLKLRAVAPAHELFLRTQGEDGMDVVCYAVPPDASVAG